MIPQPASLGQAAFLLKEYDETELDTRQSARCGGVFI